MFHGNLIVLYLYPFVDVLIFPTDTDSGRQRPHADEMSGGDLDGDMFTIIWDKKLIPSDETEVEPFDYIVPGIGTCRSVSYCTIKSVPQAKAKYTL